MDKPLSIFCDRDIPRTKMLCRARMGLQFNTVPVTAKADCRKFRRPKNQCGDRGKHRALSRMEKSCRTRCKCMLTLANSQKFDEQRCAECALTAARSTRITGWRARAITAAARFSQCGASFKCCPSHLTYEHHSNFAQAYSRMENALSTINASHPSVTTTWHYFSSLWSALKFNFSEWQCRAVSRRSTRIAADIEASTFRWD